MCPFPNLALVYQALHSVCFNAFVILFNLLILFLFSGTAVRQAMHIVKNFGIHKCGHEKKPTSGANCLISMTKDNLNTR